MAFTVSPGIVTREIDLTAIVPEIGSGAAAVVGSFNWGPILDNDGVLVTSEDELVKKFQKPDNINYNYFFTAANFLAYGNNLRVIRVANSSAKNATADPNSANTVLIKEDINYYGVYDPKSGGAANNFFGDWVAKYAGELGNSLKVSLCAADTAEKLSITGSSLAIGAATDDEHALTGTGSAFLSELQIGDVIESAANQYIVTAIASDTAATVYSNGKDAQTSGATIKRLKRSAFSEPSTNMIGTVTVAAGNTTVTGSKTKFDLQINVGDQLKIDGQDTVVKSITSNTELELATSITNAASTVAFSRKWEYEGSFDTAPTTSTFGTQKTISQDEVHVVIVDEDGDWTNSPGQVLETFPNMSVLSDAVAEDGTTIYYPDVVNRGSEYVWWMDHNPAGDANSDTSGKAWGSSSASAGANSIMTANGILKTVSLTGGVAGTSGLANADIIAGYDLLKNEERIDVGFIPTANNNTTIVNHVIDNVAEARKDCMVLISAGAGAVGETTDVDAIIAQRNGYNSTSYAMMDSGVKYQYDKYNDVYRFVPFNGDIAGLMVRTSQERDFFFSPAGFDRGQIKNVIRMKMNPTKAERDLLYKNGINPIVTFAGQGTVLFGDKTLLSKPSAFDRVNVRRLFITLEKSISTFAQAMMFEFNDEFTRARFVASVEPFLRDIQGRGGITDFAVVCDETNNTSEVVDRNEFVGSIFVKPTRSINFILLNFVAVRSGVEFSEITNVV